MAQVAGVGGMAAGNNLCAKALENMGTGEPETRRRIVNWATKILALSAIVLSQVAFAQETRPAKPTGLAAMDAAHQADAKKLLDGAVKFLLAQREKDGGWSAGPNGVYKPALTGMALRGLLGHPDFAPSVRSRENDQIIKKGFEVLLGFRQKDGGIYAPKEGQSAYTTAIAVAALKAAGESSYNEAIRDAVSYLKGLQIVPGQESPDNKKMAADDPRVGGVGYGKGPTYQPNLSVMGFWLEGLEAGGVDAKDPAVQSALGFLSRLQNRSESNTMAFVKQGAEDGGFVYALDESKGGPEGKGGLRSYGSMTYVGFKSLLYAGLARDDPRVQAAYSWIRKYWDLDNNPNLPGAQSQQGLYYYYMAFAKALRAWGEPVVKDSKGREHNWRQELVDSLKQRVKDDGSWENPADRWEEGSGVLVTAYCIMALEEAVK